MTQTVPFQDLYPGNRLVQKAFFTEAGELYRKGEFSGGPYVSAFESAFARYLGSPYCVGLNSGTSAVHLALEALGVGPGDEVVLPAFTFVGSAWGALYCGAKPVFADVSSRTGCLDPESVAAALTPRTKAVVAVHLFGMQADVAGIKALLRRRRIALIEDVAQAHGGSADGKRLGTLGDIGCFSFYPTKNLGGCGEGGAVVTASKALADKVSRLRNHGQRRRYHHETIGYNYRMDGLQGLFLKKKLAWLDRMNRNRKETAAAYLAGMRNPLVTPLCAEADASVWHLFPCRVGRRAAFLRHLGRCGIGYGVHYPHILPKLPPFRAFPRIEADGRRFPNAESLARSEVSLPLFYGMETAQIKRVIEAVNGFRY